MTKRCEICSGTSATVLTCKAHGIKDCASCHQKLNRGEVDTQYTSHLNALPRDALVAYIDATFAGEED